MEKVNLRMLASSIDARLTCIERGNHDWEKKHEECIEQMMKKLPHGSGLDSEARLDYTRSHGELIVIYQGFHAMDQDGFYDRWINFTITITASLMFGFNLKIVGDFGKYQDVKDYLYDIYSEYLTTEGR